MIIAILIGIFTGLWLVSGCPKSNLHWLDKLFDQHVCQKSRQYALEEDTNHDAEEHDVDENGYCADCDEYEEDINENE